MFTHYIKDANICYGYIYLVDKVDDFLEIATRKNNLEYCYEENCFKKDTTFMTMEIPTKNAKVDFEFLATENLTKIYVVPIRSPPYIEILEPIRLLLVLIPDLCKQNKRVRTSARKSRTGMRTLTVTLRGGKMRGN